MTRDEAVAEIQRVLGYRGDKAAEATTLLQYMQQEMENSPDLPWFLREETTSLVSIASNERMAFPTGFLKEWQEDGLYVQSISTSGYVIWTPLEKDMPSYLRQTLQDQAPSVPKGYNRDFNGYILFPTPDAIYTFRQIYYKADALLAAGNTENKWLKYLPYLLIGLAGARIAGATRDKEASATFGSMIQNGMSKINTMNTELDEAGKRQVVGGPD